MRDTIDTMPPNTFGLSPAQMKLIQEREHSSFVEMCNDRDLDPVDHARELYLFMRLSLGNHGVHLCEAGDEQMADVFLEMLERNDNFWDLLRALREMERPLTVRMISNASGIVPIHYRYLGSLAPELGIPPPRPDDLPSLERFAESIPLLHLFGTTFNAFVKRESFVGDIPCVCVFELLLSAIDHFVDIVIPVVLSEDESHDMAVVDSGVCEERGRDPEVMDALRICLDELFSAKGVETSGHNASCLSKGRFRQTYISMYTSGQNFIRMHEYGHLLMGHLSGKPCPRVEFEADKWAWRVVLAAAPSVKHWPVFAMGIMSVLVMMVVLEKHQGEEPEDTHPHASKRLWAFLRDMAECDPAFTSILMHYANGMVAACNPTLAQHYSLHIDTPDLVPDMNNDVFVAIKLCNAAQAEVRNDGQSQ